MMAVVIHKYGRPDELKWEEVDDPTVGADEVLVRTAATSVNPVDYKMRSGEAQARFPVEFPGTLGRDLSGTVLEIGKDVTGFTQGDRVFALTNKTYAEQVLVKANELARIPDDLDIVDAAALPLVLLTGEQLIMRGVKPERGWTVLIAGAVGPVGRAAVFTAKQAGALVIAGVRRQQSEQAATLGADQVLALDDKAAMEKLGFIDAVADTVGGPTASALLRKVRQGGVFASVLGPPEEAALHPTVHIVAVSAEPDVATLEQLAAEVAAKHLVIPVDRMLPLAEAAAAHRAAEKGGIGKVLLLAS